MEQRQSDPLFFIPYIIAHRIFFIRKRETCASLEESCRRNEFRNLNFLLSSRVGR